MSDNENAKPVKPVYAVYTDDSGVVISQKQYAELHGENQESRSQAVWGRSAQDETSHFGGVG